MYSFIHLLCMYMMCVKGTHLCRGQKTTWWGWLFLATFIWAHRKHYSPWSHLASFWYIFLILTHIPVQSWARARPEESQWTHNREQSVGRGARRAELKRKWNVFSATWEQFLLFSPQHHGYLSVCPGPCPLRSRGVQREVRNCLSLCVKPLLLCVTWWSLDWAVCWLAETWV